MHLSKNSESRKLGEYDVQGCNFGPDLSSRPLPTSWIKFELTHDCIWKEFHFYKEEKKIFVIPKAAEHPHSQGIHHCTLKLWRKIIYVHIINAVIAFPFFMVLRKDDKRPEKHELKFMIRMKIRNTTNQDCEFSLKTHLYSLRKTNMEEKENSE